MASLEMRGFQHKDKRNKSITMMRGKSPPHEHNNIHISNNIENYNQLRELTSIWRTAEIVSRRRPSFEFQSIIILIIQM